MFFRKDTVELFFFLEFETQTTKESKKEKNAGKSELYTIFSLKRKPTPFYQTKDLNFYNLKITSSLSTLPRFGTAQRFLLVCLLLLFFFSSFLFSTLLLLLTREYINYTSVSYGRILLPYISLQSDLAWKPSGLGQSISCSLWWYSSLLMLWYL